MEMNGELLSGPLTAALKQHIPGLQTNRWRDAAVRALLMRVRRHGAPSEFVEMIRDFQRFIPDAYVVNPGELELHFFEVEVYNPMRREKLLAYAKLQADMAYYGVDFGVYVVNKYGHINRVDLLPYYAEWLAEAHPHGLN